MVSLSTLYNNIATLVNQYVYTKEETQDNFDDFIDDEINLTNGVFIVNDDYTIPTSSSDLIAYYNGINSVSDLTGLYLSDNDMPTSIPQTCPHTISYDNDETRIRINEGNSNNTSTKYYLTIPFAISNDTDLYISVDFRTTDMGNDDFGIRICDKDALDSNNTFNSYGAWIITGQGRLAYGYGGLESHSTMYGDYLGNVSNNINYNYTFTLKENTVYYYITNLDSNTIVSQQRYARTDSYNFSGNYYLYIGGGKFSVGMPDKSVYIKNLTIGGIL